MEKKWVEEKIIERANKNVKKNSLKKEKKSVWVDAKLYNLPQARFDERSAWKLDRGSK